MAERRTRDPNIIRRVVPAANDEEEKAGKFPSADSSSSSSSGRLFMYTASHSRRERQARRRVQPLGEDESEEARDRGVPVPPVGILPETEEVGLACGLGGCSIVFLRTGTSFYISTTCYVCSSLRVLFCGVAACRYFACYARGDCIHGSCRVR